MIWKNIFKENWSLFHQNENWFLILLLGKNPDYVIINRKDKMNRYEVIGNLELINFFVSVAL